MAKDDEPNWGTHLGVGLQMAAGVGLGFLVGWWLDKRFGWSPWGVVIGSLVGLAAGMYQLIKEAMRINKD